MEKAEDILRGEALVEHLRMHLAYELARAFGMPAVPRAEWPDGVEPWRQRILKRLFFKAVDRFCRLFASFDGWVEERGVSEAARRLLPAFTDTYHANWAERIPQDEPVLLASNHPGTFDGLMIAATARRDDLKVVVSGMPFVKEMPMLSQIALFATTDTSDRMKVVRDSIRHLRDGGALLIFASGHIEPDPDILPGAREELSTWSRSLEIMLRRAPSAQFVVSIVSGVVARSCARHPVTWLRKGAHESRRLAEFLQIMRQMVFNTRYSFQPRVSFAEPVLARDVDGMGDVLRRAQFLLEAHQRSAA